MDMNLTDKNRQLWGNIFNAIKRGDLKTVIKQLDDNPNALGLIGPFGPWLHIAAMHGQVQIMNDLIKRGVDIQATGGIGECNALCDAVHENQYEAAVYLLDQGIAMELPGRPNKSPLFTAILGDRVNMLQLLIDRGINTEPDNWDPIFEAKRE